VLRHQDIQGGLYLSRGDLRPAARHHPEPPAARVFQIPTRHHGGHPDFGAALDLHTVEAGAGDPNHGKRLFIHQDLGAQDGGIGAVTVVPQIVAEYRDGVAAGGAIVVLGKQAPERRRDAQHGEVVAGDELALAKLPAGAGTRGEPGLGYGGAGDHAGEEVAAFGDLLE
jgi:hypothetical protein